MELAMDEFPLMDALVMAAAFSMFGKKRRMQDDPEYAEKEKQRQAKAAQDRYDADFAQAHLDNEEYNRSPRAFRRRLSQSKDQEREV
jgi:hypothetical protein